jgi:hypothetical protein
MYVRNETSVEWGDTARGVTVRDAEVASGPRGRGSRKPDERSCKEVDMFLHLPIAMMGMLSPVAVSDTVPSFSIASECRFEGQSPEVFDRCSKDEADARQRLEGEWGQFAATDKNTCIVESTIGGFASYVDLLTCLEMSNDVRKADSKSRDPVPNEESQTTGQGRP